MGVELGGFFCSINNAAKQRGGKKQGSIHWCLASFEFNSERIGHPRRGWKPEFKEGRSRRWMSRLVSFQVLFRIRIGYS